MSELQFWRCAALIAVLAAAAFATLLRRAERGYDSCARDRCGHLRARHGAGGCVACRELAAELADVDPDRAVCARFVG